MNASPESIEERITRLQKAGIVDLHFDLPMDLYGKRVRADVLRNDFLWQLESGGIGLIGAAVYVEDRYLPDLALPVALDQIARLYIEVAQCERFAICKSYSDIRRARKQQKIAVLIALEGVEPLGGDIDLLQIFYQLGVRIIGLTHARPNAAGSGGVFAPTGSPLEGLTPFGRDVVRECEALGIVLDLAHINPAGFDDILEITSGPLIVSHTNVRRYYDIERNINDEQIREIGARGGVIGISTVLVSQVKDKSTLDHYVDHLQHVIDLIGIDAAAIGFDFFEFIYRQWSEHERADFHQKFPSVHLIPGLSNHAHAANLTRKLIERGFRDREVEKILIGNWMRILRLLL